MDPNARFTLKSWFHCRTTNLNVPATTTTPNPRFYNRNPFRPQPVDIETVALTVKDLKNTKSYGSDGIQLKYIE